MYFTITGEFVSLSFGACLLFIYLGTLNSFGGDVCPPALGDYKQPSRKRLGKLTEKIN